MAACALLACGEPGDLLPGPTRSDSDGGDATVVNPIMPIMRGTDSGLPDAGPDGTSGDAISLRPGCYASEDTVIAVTDDSGQDRLLERRVFQQYDCGERQLLLGISNGSCNPHVPRQLLITIGVDAIGTQVTAGPNAVQEAPFDDFLSARYVEREASWGTCRGAAGTISLTDLGDRAGDRWAGNYSLTLTRCDGVGSPVEVNGTLDIPIEASFEEACP